MPVISFGDAIYEATAEKMTANPNMHVLGLGASYANGLDGTMRDLAVQYSDRVHDMPCSENSLTGMAVGMAISGLTPLAHHGRIEFALHAADQLLTQAARWNYMFGGGYPCPLTVRIAMGRQWGNGPQHTMNHKAIFAIPGLKVVCPSTPASAKGLLIAALEDQTPVIYLESRWLYKLKGSVGTGPVALDKAQVLISGADVTIVAVGDMVIEALKAAGWLSKLGISAEVIDLVSVYPIDRQTIQESADKTGRVIVVDSSTPAYSVASEVSAFVRASCAMLTCPDHPCPTAPSLTASYYPTDRDIVECAAAFLCCGPIELPSVRTFAELNLPPTDNIDDLIAESVNAG